MKVFGKGGGAYDSDYMAAIEDAMILGCDSANLSLGSGNPGMSRQSDAKYQAILEAVVNSGMVVAMSAGNSGHWFENTPYGYPYAESVSWATNGSPGSYTNSLGVASVDNVGSTGNYVEFAGTKMFYTDTTEAPIQPMTALAGEQRFVYVDAVGNPEDFAAAGCATAVKSTSPPRATTPLPPVPSAPSWSTTRPVPSICPPTAILPPLPMFP